MSGSDLILNFILEYFPDPAEHGPWKGALNGAETERAVKDSAPVSAFVFKTVADPFAGRVSYFKVISGVVRNDANLVNARSSARGAPVPHRGAVRQNHPPVTELHAGDLGGVAKLKDTLTGDTLDEKTSLIAYPAVQLAGALDRLRDFRQDPQR